MGGRVGPAECWRWARCLPQVKITCRSFHRRGAGCLRDIQWFRPRQVNDQEDWDLESILCGAVFFD